MTNTDTCVINKIRIRVDVFGDRKREEIEINRHIYSTVPLPSKTNWRAAEKQVWWIQKQLWWICLRQNFPAWQQFWIMTSPSRPRGEASAQAWNRLKVPSQMLQRPTEVEFLLALSGKRLRGKHVWRTPRQGDVYQVAERSLWEGWYSRLIKQALFVREWLCSGCSLSQPEGFRTVVLSWEPTEKEPDGRFLWHQTEQDELFKTTQMIQQLSGGDKLRFTITNHIPGPW